MDVVREIEACREARSELEGRVAFVPTMGALHEGHFALMRRGLEIAEHLVVSIYVNPTQFGPDSDYAEYPRELEEDAAACRELGASLVFAPSDAVMYGDDHATVVRVEDLDDVLCGPERPGHFEGVTTIVTKLFNVVQPDVAVFGEKDFQQLAILRRMVRDLNMPIELEGVPTVRAEDGIAVSSRNRYLSDQERRQARTLSRALIQVHEAYEAGQRDASALEGIVRERLLEAVGPEAIEYIECVHPVSLERWSGTESGEIDDTQGAVVALAVHVGEARLIDHVHLDESLPEALDALG
jgi:pantoate--beta-alanine ligase